MAMLSEDSESVYVDSPPPESRIRTQLFCEAPGCSAVFTNTYKRLEHYDAYHLEKVNCDVTGCRVSNLRIINVERHFRKAHPERAGQMLRQFEGTNGESEVNVSNSGKPTSKSLKRCRRNNPSTIQQAAQRNKRTKIQDFGAEQHQNSAAAEEQILADASQSQHAIEIARHTEAITQESHATTNTESTPILTDPHKRAASIQERILKEAREQANRILKKAQEEASRVLMVAQKQENAASIKDHALKNAQREADCILKDAHIQAATIKGRNASVFEEATQQAEAIKATAKVEATQQAEAIKIQAEAEAIQQAEAIKTQAKAEATRQAEAIKAQVEAELGRRRTSLLSDYKVKKEGMFAGKLTYSEIVTLEDQDFVNYHILMRVGGG